MMVLRRKDKDVAADLGEIRELLVKLQVIADLALTKADALAEKLEVEGPPHDADRA